MLGGNGDEEKEEVEEGTAGNRRLVLTLVIHNVAAAAAAAAASAATAVAVAVAVAIRVGGKKGGIQLSKLDKQEVCKKGCPARE